MNDTSNETNKPKIDEIPPDAHPSSRGRPRQTNINSSDADKIERVALSQSAVARLDVWIQEVEGSRPGVEISRRDLVDWLIMGRAEHLSSDEIRHLADSHYNELRFLQVALKELKAARTRGDTMSLQDFVARLPGGADIAAKAKRGRKKKLDVDGQDATTSDVELQVTST